MLKSLHIKNFRMLEDFKVEKLGRLNLIVGKNNSGKSTVLEALRIYAGYGHPAVLQAIAFDHNEPVLGSGAAAEASSVELPFAAFFPGREFSSKRPIRVGPSGNDDGSLTIASGYLAEEDLPGTGDDVVSQSRTRFIVHIEDALLEADVTPCLRVTRSGDPRSTFHILLDRPPSRRPRGFGAACSLIPTRFVSSDELADEWDRIALTDDQTELAEAFRIITPDFEDLTFVRDADAGSRRRIAKVKLSTVLRPVPLASLGDGAVRILQLALKLFPAKGGFLLIDEFENGLHFSVQEKVWGLLFRMAEKLDIQVFATTHSWDCIESFARAAHANQAVEGVLFRVGQSVLTSDNGRTIATVFDEEQLYTITQADVEVR